jgi:preprotein translocase subunit YajC
MNELLNPSFVLAQQDVPLDVGGAPNVTQPAPTGTNGAPGPTPGATPGPGGGNLMIFFIVIIAAMLFFTMWSSRRDRKRREAMISAVKKHDRVQTIGGVIGSVVEIKPDYIVLKVDESSNTRITFARSAVQQVLTVSPEPSATSVKEEPS